VMSVVERTRSSRPASQPRRGDVLSLAA
jgi:hypothetical protein